MNTPAFRRHAVAAAALCCAVGAAQAAPLRAAATPADVLASLSGNAGGQLTNAPQPASSYNVVYAAPGAVLLADNAGAAPADRAVNFLNLYGALPGVTDASRQLQVQRVSTDVAGFQHVHMDQVQSGLPVFGARLVVHMNAQGITGVNGAFIKGLESLSTTPAQSYATLQATALRAAQKLHPGQALAIESSRLMFYNTGMLVDRAGSNRLAYEVMVKGANVSGIRERMILDANQNTLLNRINEIHSVLNRKIYTPVLMANGTEAPATLTEKGATSPADPAFVGDTKGSPASSRTHGPGTEPLENLYIYAGGTYNLYKNLFGFEGYDFTRPHSPQVQKSVYLVNQQCPNAYWDGTSTNYCPGFDADDVVSHEWSHAYTEYTHGLIYSYQSGALNESYSDIFGETYDLIDGFEGPLSANLTEGKYHADGGSRWVVGEDLSDEAAALLLRDMWDPDSFATPSPGSVITSAAYYCGTSDAGGVHTNSGVSNHAYAMLVDGKTFNNVKIPAIGLSKAAAIYSYAEAHIQTPTTNYTSHAAALEQSCAALIGKTINDVFGKPVADTARITVADCDAVHQATLAVEMRGKVNADGTLTKVAEKCGYLPVLKPEATTPALCGAGKGAASLFKETFEGAAALPAGWTQGKQLAATGDTDIAPWTTSTNLPLTHAGLGRAAFFKNDKGGTCGPGGDQSASHYLDTPAVTMPADLAANKVMLRFTHFLETEGTVDGGQLKVSVNGGAFQLVPVERAASTTAAATPSAFIHNGHSSTFAFLTPLGNNTNNLNYNQKGWSGIDPGEASSQWGTTIVDLSKLTTVPTAGQTVKFRYDFTNDGCNGDIGWFVDDVVAYQCVANAAPVAAFRTVTPTTAVAPAVVTFDAGDSADADAAAGDKVASYTMDFGDNSGKVTQDTAVFKHSYATKGSYTASLTVTDTRETTSAAVTRQVNLVDASVQPFTFAERKDVDPAKVITSDEVTLSGAGSLPISIAGGSNAQYSINGGAFTSDAGKISAGDKLVVRHTSAAAAGTATTTTVTVGSYATTFKSTTKAASAGTGSGSGGSTGTGGGAGTSPTTGADHVPDAFDFGTQDGVNPGVAYTSKAIVPQNYDDAPITATQLSYSIDGAPFTTAKGTIKKGQTVRVQMTSSKASLGYAKGYITVGGVKATYTLRTKK